MIVSDQNPPTDIEVIVKRANPKNNKLERILPDPLATPKEEILIKDSSASAYEIKKGTYSSNRFIRKTMLGFYGI